MINWSIWVSSHTHSHQKTYQISTKGSNSFGVNIEGWEKEIRRHLRHKWICKSLRFFFFLLENFLTFYCAFLHAYVRKWLFGISWHIVNESVYRPHRLFFFSGVLRSFFFWLNQDIRFVFSSVHLKRWRRKERWSPTCFPKATLHHAQFLISSKQLTKIALRFVWVAKQSYNIRGFYLQARFENIYEIKFLISWIITWDAWDS